MTTLTLLLYITFGLLFIAFVVGVAINELYAKISEWRFDRRD